MTDCRSDRAARRLGGVVLLAAALMATGTAQAQTRGPILLGPPTPLAPSPSTDQAPSTLAPSASAPSAPVQSTDAPSFGATATPAPAAPAQPAVRTTADGSIKIEGLTRLTADAAGTLTPDSGGLPTDLWHGTPGPVALRLVALLSASPDSLVLRDLQRRLLLSSGPAPEGLTEGTLLAARAERLLAMGALDELGALAAVVPGREDDPALARALTDRALAAGDDDTACNFHDALASRADDRYWVKVGVVCDLKHGDTAKAEFGVRLLDEIGQPDALLQELVQGVVAGRTGGPQRLLNAGPVHLAAARVAGVPIDPDVDSIESLPVLVALARGIGKPPFAARLAAAEKAEQAGAVTVDDLTTLYGDVAVQPGKVDGALRAAEADPSPYGRALLWRAAETATDPAQRVEVIRKALDLAEDSTSWRQTARVFAPLVRRLEIGPASEVLAADAIRILIVTGQPAAARPWLEWLRTRAAAGNAAAREAARRIWMIAWIGGGEQLVPYQEAAVSAWWDGLRTSDPDEASSRGAAALALMDALGAPIGVDAWRGLAATPPTNLYETPTVAFRNGVAAGAAAGRLAETVALGCAGFGDAALDDLDPTAVAGVVTALRKLGLEDDARRFAAEAAIAYGL